MTLFAELKRRNVLRVAAAYVAVSWLLIQVVETLFPVFGLSDAAIRAVVLVLAIGFVPAVIVAWAFELTPEGFVRDSEVDRSSVIIKARTQRLDRIVMVALALAVGFFAFDKFVLDPARDEAREQAIAETAREAGRTEAVEARRESGPPVIAVLPFSAVTANDDSEFFAAGVHDDLLTRLAQLPSMLVVSRTSVLEYKDVQRNIREIGEALGADAILEGGVQSAGNRIRINAQLIDAKTDEHLWAETYDRELTAASIFDVQDDIAEAIAEAMRVTLGERATRQLIPTSNMAAYRAYHEAIAISDASAGGAQSEEYRALLHKAVELDPAFTRPLALLVGSYSISTFDNSDPDLIARSEALVERIREVAPGSTDHLIAQTYYTYYVLKDYRLAHQLASEALKMAPSDAHILAIRSWIERRMGDFDAMVESIRRQRQLEPHNESLTFSLVFNLMNAHRYDEAEAELAASDLKTYGVEWARAILRVREHGSLETYAADAARLAGEFRSPQSVLNLWWSRVISRNYEGAMQTLALFPDNAPAGQFGVSEKTMAQLFTALAMDDDEQMQALLDDIRTRLDALGPREETLETMAALTLAAVAGMEGNASQAEEYVERWFTRAGLDWPDRVLYRETACQILGIAGAAEAAVQCIRDGLEEPSMLMPFIEPKLPFYDSIRDEPEFIELARELANQS